MISNDFPSRVEKKLGTPLYSMQELIGSDLRLFYGQNGEDSAYQKYLTQLYSGIFGDRKINEKHTIAEWLESAETEMVRNAAEWGNEGYPYTHVLVKRNFYPLDVLVRVKDQGKGFDYLKIQDRDSDILSRELDDKTPDEIQLLTRRRPAISHPSRIVRGALRVGEFFSGRQISPDGGQGFKRLILDSYGETGFNYEGNEVGYHLPKVDITKEDLEKIKRMSFEDYIVRAGE